MLGLSQLFPTPEEQPTSAPTLTVISQGMTFRGTGISGSGDLRIEGAVWADISVEGRLYVAPGAEVYGDVHAQSIMVAGYVEGGLRADEKLVLTSQATVSATLRMGTLRIDSGAQFEGTVQPLEGEQSEAPLFLDDDEASESIPPQPVPSAEPSPSSDLDLSDDRSSSNGGTASSSEEESESSVEEADAESSRSPSAEEPAPPNASSVDPSDEDEEDESSYGFQW